MYSQLEDKFLAYINSYTFDAEKQHMLDILKLQHTKRVVELSEVLAASVFCGDNASEYINLAKIIALLHDIGRWEQMRINEFNDITHDHGDIGADIIIKHGMLDGIGTHE